MHDNGNDELDRFSWIGSSAIQEAGCLTLVSGADTQAVLDAFGAVPERSRSLDFDEFCEESFAYHDRYSMIAVREVGEWLLVVEDNWFEGARPEVLRTLSAGTEVVSAFWNVNALTRFSHAVDGEVRTCFEALMPEFREGTQPDALEEVRAGLPWPGDDRRELGGRTVMLMLALMSRITGKTVSPDWLDGQFDTYPVARWPDDLPTRVDVPQDRLGDDFPADLVEPLRESTDTVRRRAAAAVARRAFRVADSGDRVAFADCLRALGSGRKADAGAVGEAIRQWEWQVSTQESRGRDKQRLLAAEVVRQAANPDSFLAVFGALAAAKQVRGVDWEELPQVAATVVAEAEPTPR